MKTLKVKKLTKLELAQHDLNIERVENALLKTRNKELAAVVQTHANTAEKRPFRRLVVTLEDAKGKPLSSSMFFIEKGDSVSLTATDDGGFQLRNNTDEER